ncbi:MAG: decarboxylating NADP(+)-dependent phosphogluconate dehydrogenase [Candidatus Thioglobus sp.]|mgnify:FL=1|jgi:6-phosphogluconate dehydrogenase|nr:decarboxylating NADP(+)-dependent phosphogluconate dehydrogenase [Candidatus Thioglobus sp.]|tara:strand:+ start:573 stop:1997 length:1425 start_codon:yes stop_codon:yes gene_type:complete
MNNNQSDIGLIGLGVMGVNLALNLESHGYQVSVHNRSRKEIDDLTNIRAKEKNIVGCADIADFINSIKKPRKVMMMVKAGKVVDNYIDKLIPHLDKGDIIIDGGNSHYSDSIRRSKSLEEKGFYFIGAGVSGGGEGALKGPSIMPGGSTSAWPEVKDIFQSISAKVENNEPCCDWIGGDGSGHFVKMVHNGIEYGDMQLICEAYQIMKDVLEMTNDEMHQVFKQWNKGDLSSYLIEITADILAFKDKDGSPLIDNILDTAEQKGTGKWTAEAALELGTPLTLIGEAVFSRFLSTIKQERVEASKLFSNSSARFKGNKTQTLNDIHDALYASKIVSYAQGYTLLSEAAKQYNWKLNYGAIAMMWRGGCIIRSAFLNKIKAAYDNNPDTKNLLLDPFFNDKIKACQEGWRRIASLALINGVPVPAMTSSLCYFDGYRSAKLPANLLQAQRDYFGTHSYERIDKPRGDYFHTEWINQ